MNPHLRFSSFLMIVVIVILIAVYVTTSSGADNEQFVNCGSQFFRCGNLENIGYPFWGGDRPEYCGHPELELRCQNDVAHLTIGSTTYRVLAMSPTDQSPTVAREDFWNDTCPVHLYNATLDTGLFSYAPSTRNLTLHYGCTYITGQPPPPLMPFQFTCEVNDTTITNYYWLGDLNMDLVRCNTSVNVQVSTEAADTLLAGNLTNLSTVLDDGFMLLPNNTACVNCVESGGRCGFNSRSFTCYCIDGPYVYQCNRTDQASSGMCP